jgi:hypothetical protein
MPPGAWATTRNSLMPASPVTMPQAKQAVLMYQQGHSQPQIAVALGLCRSSVRTALRLMDVQPRSQTEGYRSWLALRGGVGNKITVKEQP